MQVISFLRRAAKSAVRRVVPPLARQLDSRAYMRIAVIPSGLQDRDLTTNVPSDKVACTGIDFRSHDQISRLQSWREQYSTLYELLRGDPAINLQMGRSYLQNAWFETPDAEAYASMICDIRPSHVIEVGGGFSTLIARRAIDYLGLPTQLVVVDPEPRTNVTHVADVLIRSRVEETDLSSLPLAEGVLLFIDSSHVVRARGDVQFLLDSVVPSLGVGSTVHVHDVFLPWDYPFSFQARLYTEQYLFQAMLAFSSRYKVLLSTHYMSRCFVEEMQATFGAIVGNHHQHFGASFWLEVVS
jgi:hypothetical protein